MTRYFGFAVADAMFPANAVASRRPLTGEEVKTLLAEGYVSCCNPQHKTTLQAAKLRYDLDIVVPEKAPMVALGVGDQVVVMSVRGLPRLEENRHEYSEDEVAKATFVFGLWTVIGTTAYSRLFTHGGEGEFTVVE